MAPPTHGNRGTPWAVYGTISTPVIVTDRDGRIVYLNPRAAAFWGVRAATVRGRLAWTALGLGPADGGDHEFWVRSVLSPALASEAPVLSRAQTADRGEHRVEITGFWATHRGEAFAVLTASEMRADVGVGLPGAHPVERDPLTSLPTLGYLQQVAKEWNGRSGTVVFFDLDGLKEINARSGQAAGDRALAALGRALAAEAPPGALAIRYADDEFVLLVDGTDACRATDIAGRVAARAAAESAGSFPVHLGHGVSVFEPGGLDVAVRRANDALREQRGVLFRGASGGRIVLTRAARHRLQSPAAEPERSPTPPFASCFGSDLDCCFQQAFARSADHAREFVSFVDPGQGAAVVEVGAGSGRITFDGDLAERIGAGGQLLVTDPSARQLAVASRRAFDLGLYWLRFLQAPVEDLPLASATADLVVGSGFLSWTSPEVALRAMARLVRPGGRVALNATVNLTWGAAWAEGLEPVLRELRAEGVPPRLAGRDDLEAAFRGAGLRIVDVQVSCHERGVFPHVDLALQAARQGGPMPLALRRVAEARHPAMLKAVEEAVRRAYARPRSADDTAWEAETISFVARRPA